MTEGMKENARNFWVGMFVLAAGAVCGTLMVWFGEVPDWLATGEWTLRISEVDELRGIGEGSPVKLNGVEIGRVQNIDFADTQRPDKGVVIITRIKQRYSVPKGATAYVYGATLGFGSGHIDIIVGPEMVPIPVDKENAVIKGRMKSIFQDIISMGMIDAVQNTITNFGGLAEDARPFVKSLNNLIEQRPLDAEDVTPNFSSVLQRLDQAILHFNQVVGDDEVKSDVKIALRDLDDITKALKDTIILWQKESQKLSNNLNSGIDKTEQNLDESFVKLNRVLENLDDTTTHLAHITQKIADGEGTVGKLTNDGRLYESAVIAVDRLADVMLNLKIITGKIKQDGYIIVGQAPHGILKKNFKIPVQASDFP